MTVKILFINIILLIYCLATLSSCNSIENTAWKYRDGFHIGDGIKFDSSLTLKNDTIYSNKNPIAIFVKTKQRITDKLLIIKDINSDSIGTYCSK